MRSCLSVIAALFAAVLGLCGSCFLLAGVAGMTSKESWAYALVFTLIGAGLLYGAFETIRRVIIRRS
jgi:hypothetical protein